jgi:predicted hotdog family 3-hydroxylacyl-ACP dehydratase
MQEKLEIVDSFIEELGEPIVSYPEILEYIPHRPPIVMIDSIYKAEKTSASTGLTVSADNIFCMDGKLTESGLIENIAQSAAAGVGVYYKVNNLPIPIGFIGGIRKLEIYDLPEVNSDIYTEINVINEVFDISIVRGVVHSKKGILAVCEIKVLVKKD